MPQPPRASLRTSRQRRAAQRRVLEWFDRTSRSFPWRQTRDGYRTLVAEVMLQQTQTSRVAPIYTEFLRRYPTCATLAAASRADVIAAWKGLGYNRRAVALHRAAQQVTAAGGVFPSGVSALRSLPGVGEYTANAVACFAFDAQVPVVDVNVRRVLARADAGVDGLVLTTKAAESLAGEWLPAGDAYRWNQALMDIGATLCRAGSPRCIGCPLATGCAYRATRATNAARGDSGPPPARVSGRGQRAPERFEGSSRQRRGAIVNMLRHSPKGLTVGAVLAGLSLGGLPVEANAVQSALLGLERDGLVDLTPAARDGSTRGLVRLPA